jgi:hypothetical protein
MRISKLISILEKRKEMYGDVNVVIWDGEYERHINAAERYMSLGDHEMISNKISKNSLCLNTLDD